MQQEVKENLNEETQVDVPIADQDKEVEIELPEKKDETVFENEEKVEETAKTEADTTEHEEYSAKVKKRIDKMTAKLREAERREKAAVEYAQNVQTHLEKEKNKVNLLDKNFQTETEGRIDSQLAIVEANLQDAVEKQDGKAVVEAQKLLSQLVIQKESLRASKNKREQEEKQQPKQEQQPYAPQQQQIDPKAKKWAEENEWFMQDRVMTSGAYAIHEQLSAEGFDLSSDEYYDELNNRMKKEFPHKFKKQEQTNNNVQNVAPATKTSKSGRTRSIKLTPSEVSIARRLGVPLEEYAKFVRR